MIHCVPKAVHSYDYTLTGDGHAAQAMFKWAGEGGTLTIDGENFAVERESSFSRIWTLEGSEGTVVTARKTSPFKRAFAIQGPSGEALLRASAPIGRRMVLQYGEHRAKIAPDRPFSRNASITGQVPDFKTTAFAFWLTVLLWRRSRH